MTSRQDRSRTVGWSVRTVRTGRAAGGLLAVMALAGCAVGGSATGQSPSTAPRADLAAEAEVAARNLEGTPDGRRTERGDGNRGGTRSGAAGSGDGPRPGSKSVGGAASPAAPDDAEVPGANPGARGGASWSTLLAVTDPVTDVGAAPGYADLVGLFLEDDGRRLRVTLRFRELVPGRLGDREVEGIGVDLFRAGSQESDYQLFLDGGGHGWRGFLQTPSGFVAYPGTLALRGAVLTTTVPWAAIGGRRGGEVSAFADWSDGSGRTGADLVDRRSLGLS